MKVHELITLLQTYDPEARVVCNSSYAVNQELTRELTYEDVSLQEKVGCTYQEGGTIYYTTPGDGEGNRVSDEEHVVSLTGF